MHSPPNLIFDIFENGLLVALMMAGTPKYFSASLELAMPNIEHKTDCVSSGTFGLKDTRFFKDYFLT